MANVDTSSSISGGRSKKSSTEGFIPSSSVASESNGHDKSWLQRSDAVRELKVGFSKAYDQLCVGFKQAWREIADALQRSAHQMK